MDAEILSNGEYKIIELNETKLLVFKNGTIYRFSWNNWKIVKTTNNTSDGYNRIKIDKKNISRHRIMGFTFLNLDITDTKQQIDHIDGNRINNNLDNLRVVNQQQNNWNRTKAKGYYWRKRAKKWISHIIINYKSIHLGCFDNEDDARNAYLEAKKIYHII